MFLCLELPYISIISNSGHKLSESKMAYRKGMSACSKWLYFPISIGYYHQSDQVLDNYTYQFIKAIGYTFGTTNSNKWYLTVMFQTITLISQTNKCGNENTNLSHKVSPFYSNFLHKITQNCPFGRNICFYNFFTSHVISQCHETDRLHV